MSLEQIGLKIGELLHQDGKRTQRVELARQVFEMYSDSPGALSDALFWHTARFVRNPDPDNWNRLTALMYTHQQIKCNGGRQCP